MDNNLNIGQGRCKKCKCTVTSIEIRENNGFCILCKKEIQKKKDAADLEQSSQDLFMIASMIF